MWICFVSVFETLQAIPLHPAFVHFPLAMLSVTWGLVVAHHWSGSETLERLVAPFEWIGVSFLPIVILSGLRDAEWFEFLIEVEWDQPLVWHFAISMTASVVFTIHAVWRRNRGVETAGRWIDLGLTTTGLWLLILTGLIAGEMVYG
jgi:uncharacterized membrane protein